MEIKNLVKSIQYFVLDKNSLSMNVVNIDLRELTECVIKSLDTALKRYCINVKVEFRIP